MLLLAAAFLVAFVLLLYMVSPLISPKPLALPGAHVVVSGLLLLRRRLPAGSAAPSPPRARPLARRPATEAQPPASLSPRRATCRRAARPRPCGGPRGPALRRSWPSPRCVWGEVPGR